MGVIFVRLHRLNLAIFLFLEDKMQLSAPKVVTFWIAVLLGVLGFIGTLATIPLVSPYAFWFVFFGFALLAVANLTKGL